MRAFGCAREKEVAMLLELGQWPQASPAELRAHAAGCRVCAQRVLLTESMRAARAAAMAEPQLVSPGALWWRAQLRRRNAALERISKPLLGAQVFALALAVLAAVGLLVWQLRGGLQAKSWVAGLERALNLGTLLPDALPGGGLGWLVPVLALLALAGGVAVYWSTEKQ
jgi:hypothetical protein